MFVAVVSAGGNIFSVACRDFLLLCSDVALTSADRHDHVSVFHTSAQDISAREFLRIREAT